MRGFLLHEGNPRRGSYFPKEGSDTSERYKVPCTFSFPHASLSHKACMKNPYSRTRLFFFCEQICTHRFVLFPRGATFLTCWLYLYGWPRVIRNSKKFLDENAERSQDYATRLVYFYVISISFLVESLNVWDYRSCEFFGARKLDLSFKCRNVYRLFCLFTQCRI